MNWALIVKYPDPETNKTNIIFEVRDSRQVVEEIVEQLKQVDWGVPREFYITMVVESFNEAT